jgi:hypothetical protein
MEKSRLSSEPFPATYKECGLCSCQPVTELSYVCTQNLNANVDMPAAQPAIDS